MKVVISLVSFILLSRFSTTAFAAEMINEAQQQLNNDLNINNFQNIANNQNIDDNLILGKRNLQAADAGRRDTARRRLNQDIEEIPMEQ